MSEVRVPSADGGRLIGRGGWNHHTIGTLSPGEILREELHRESQGGDHEQPDEGARFFRGIGTVLCVTLLRAQECLQCQKRPNHCSSFGRFCTENVVFTAETSFELHLRSGAVRWKDLLLHIGRGVLWLHEEYRYVSREDGAPDPFVPRWSLVLE